MFDSSETKRFKNVIWIIRKCNSFCDTTDKMIVDFFEFLDRDSKQGFSRRQMQEVAIENLANQMRKTHRMLSTFHTNIK